jgi:cell wall-associated NlpC family hydrolase
MNVTRAAIVGAVLTLAGLGAGCASSGAVPRPFPSPRGSPGPIGSIDGHALATTALGLQGVPYRAGGTDPSGFDCSGLVQYVFAQHAIGMPRIVRDQFEAGRGVDARDLRPGDLVFFVTSGGDVSHVGIAIGGERFVHAPNARGAVRVESLEASYWRDRYAGARRVE